MWGSFMGTIIIARLVIFNKTLIAHSRQALWQKNERQNAKLEDTIPLDRDI